MRKPWYRQLYFWVLVGVVLGVLYGYCFPTNPVPEQFSLARNPAFAKFPLGEAFKPLGEIFINLVKMLIAPIIFCTVVGGIASVGDLKKVGRVGVKAIVYFELVTTLAMFIALAVVHVLKPGEGVNYTPTASEVKKAADFAAAGKQQSAIDFVMHIVPKTAVSAFTEGEILQVLLISVLLGVALSKMDARGEPLLHLVHQVARAFFYVVGFVVRLAPLATFGAMAAAVGGSGIKAFLALLKMMGCFYLTCILFIFVVLGLIAFFNGFSILKYLRHIKDEILLVLGTSSSESALPPMMEKMERTGCTPDVVGLVLPSGYSFNLDGTSIYLAMAIVFLSQVTNTPLSFGTELGLLGLLLLTSKGAAAVTGGGFITLSATLAATNNPTMTAGLAFLIGIDRFMSEARAITNLIGNGLATLLIAKSERELDYSKATPVLLDSTLANRATGRDASPRRP
ncbi:MAG: C4-dicarboxylate transporter DctA [Verrucomicrobia bacterium]|nr:C4-dicarboxylate transporter DctA [Verrucomicrobiota bacterium]